MDDQLINHLNLEQQQAVKQTEGPMLILAGAGSGKTTVLTTKIAYILRKKLANPNEILAVTFTNKAAKEMRQRIAKLLFREVDNRMFMPFMGTFHSICVRILRSYGDYIDLSKNFVIYDESDKLAVIKKIYKDLQISDKSYPPRAISHLLSEAKNEMINNSMEEYLSSLNNPLANIALKVLPNYNSELKLASALDFDDLIVKTIDLFKLNEEVRLHYREQFKYILVDEYQDTNAMQYLLIKLLVNKNNNITVIGDDWQTIFSWRGADYRNILNFENDYDNCIVIKLEQNYRSTKAILDASNKIISKNSQRSEKRMWTDKTSGQPVKHIQAMSERDEAELIAKKVYLNYSKKLYSYKDFAVLYRTNAQSRAIEEAFLRYALPYKVIGGLRFYDRKEIKDLVAYLRFIYQPDDLVSFARIINIPTRGIGPKSLEKFYFLLREHNLSLFKGLEFVANNSDLFTNKIQKSFSEIYYLVKSIMVYALDHNVEEVIKKLINESNYLEFLDDGSTQGSARQENVKEFLSVASEFKHLSLGEFLEEVSLVSDIDGLSSEQDSITLMTVHSAKGLEFPVVFMVGMEESIFPHANSFLDINQLEEERRLCYVGMTRAKEQLYLSSANSRMLYGGMMYNPPSRFLSEIELIEDVLDNYSNSSFSRTGSSLSPSQLETNSYSLDPIKNSEPRYVPDIEVGDKVRHKIFGTGIILEINHDIAIINFKNTAIKKLDISYAPLEKL